MTQHSAATSSNSAWTPVAFWPMDRDKPVKLLARIVQPNPGGLRLRASFPIVEYVMPGLTDEPMPTVVGFAGGGSSGILFGLLAEHAARHGVRVVSFDMPGHTPPDLLGVDTPGRDLVSRANAAVRRHVADSVLRRWAPRATNLEVLSHSAGIVDLARTIPAWGDRIGRYVITGAGIPGIAAMRTAQRGAASAGAAEKVRLGTLLKTRTIPTGNAAIHFGADTDEHRARAAASYEGHEHVCAVLPLLTSRSVLSHDWAGRNVLLVGSDGDAISPPDRIRAAERTLAHRGAATEVLLLSDGPPHIFIAFDAAAKRIADTAWGARASSGHI